MQILLRLLSIALILAEPDVVFLCVFGTILISRLKSYYAPRQLPGTYLQSFFWACVRSEYDYDDQQVLLLQFKFCHYLSDCLHITQYILFFTFIILPDDLL